MAFNGKARSNTFSMGVDTIAIELEWQLKSRDFVNKTGDVYYVLKATGLKNPYAWYKVYNPSLVINGNTINGTSGVTAYNGTILISGTVKIPYNSDGTKTFSFSAKASAYWSSGTNMSLSGTGELERIPTKPPSVTGTATVIGIKQSLLGSNHIGVSGVHEVKVKVASMQYNGATAKSCVVEFQGKNYAGWDVNIPLNGNGTYSIFATVTDSYGMSSTKTKIADIIIRPYANPTLSVSLARHSGSTPNPLGVDVRITGSVGITNVNNSSGANINNAYWKISLENNEYKTRTIAYTKSGISITLSPTWTITYRDEFKTFIRNIVVPYGNATAVMGKNSFGVGVVPPENGKGLYLVDDLINGNHYTRRLPKKWVNYKTYGAGAYIEAVKQNWSSIPSGFSVMEAEAGARGILFVYKYETGNHGFVVEFGYKRGVKQWYYENGTWGSTAI